MKKKSIALLCLGFLMFACAKDETEKSNPSSNPGNPGPTLPHSYFSFDVGAETHFWAHFGYENPVGQVYNIKATNSDSTVSMTFRLSSFSGQGEYSLGSGSNDGVYFTDAEGTVYTTWNQNASGAIMVDTLNTSDTTMSGSYTFNVVAPNSDEVQLSGIFENIPEL